MYVAFKQFTPEQIEEILNQFSNADYTFIFISLLFAIVGYVSRAYRWLFLLEHLGHKVPLRTSIIAVCASYLTNLTIPRSGEVTRAAIISKANNVPFQEGFGTIIAERIIDLIILLSITALAFILKLDVLLTFVPIHLFSLGNSILIGLIIISLIALIYYLFKHSKIKIIALIKNKIQGLIEGVQAIFHIEKKGAFIFHTFLIWSSYLLMFYATIFTFKETAILSFEEVIVAFVVGSFAIAFTNGGFGAYPLLISKVLFLFLVPETIGTAFGWIVWTSQFLLVLILGGISFIALPFIIRAENNK